MMLRSIAGLGEGTPVAASCSSRGVEERAMELDVHRVTFQRKKASVSAEQVSPGRAGGPRL